MIDLDGPIFLSLRLICLQVLPLQANAVTKHSVRAGGGLTRAVSESFGHSGGTRAELFIDPMISESKEFFFFLRSSIRFAC